MIIIFKFFTKIEKMIKISFTLELTNIDLGFKVKMWSFGNKILNYKNKSKIFENRY